MKITLTEYMNKSIFLRHKLIDFCISLGNEAQETRNTLHLLDLMDSKAKDDLKYRVELFNWFNLNSSTLKLRELSLVVGIDYWKDLKNSSIIDTFDSFHCVLWNERHFKNNRKSIGKYGA